MKSSRFKLGTQNHKTPRKAIIVGVIALLTIALLAGVYTFRQNQLTSKQQATQKQNDEAQTESSKKDTIENRAAVNGVTGHLTKDGVPPNTEGVVVVTNAAQSNGQVTASANISGGTQPGACVFTFSIEGDRPVVRELNAKQENNVQSCSITIPDVEFSRLGVWNLNVTYYSDNKRIEANHEVTIN